jgi:hypothetical protein
MQNFGGEISWKIAKSRRLRWTRIGETSNTFRSLVANPPGKRLLGRPGKGLGDNVKKYRREMS